eukprot:COSAG05_NODE_2560_length_2902_cov_2.007135_1_plen_34_part_10
MPASVIRQYATVAWPVMSHDEKLEEQEEEEEEEE